MIIDLEEAKKEIERGHKFREVDKETLCTRICVIIIIAIYYIIV